MGLGVITSRIFSGRMSPTRSIKRLKSPSVKIPLTLSVSSTMAVIPIFFFVISFTASITDASIRTTGVASPLRMTSLTWVRRRRPSAPPGWERAKSSGPNPLASKQATARASPIASVAVVEDVGAKFRGQASRETCTLRLTVASFASVLSSEPVMEITGAPSRMTVGMIVSSSEVVPE